MGPRVWPVGYASETRDPCAWLFLLSQNFYVTHLTPRVWCASMALVDPDKLEVPSEIIEGQLAKLEKATAG